MISTIGGKGNLQKHPFNGIKSVNRCILKTLKQKNIKKQANMRNHRVSQCQNDLKMKIV